MIQTDTVSIGFKEQVYLYTSQTRLPRRMWIEIGWPRLGQLENQRQPATGAVVLRQTGMASAARAPDCFPLRLELQLLQMPKANPMRQRALGRAMFFGLAPGAHGHGEPEFNLGRGHGKSSKCHGINDKASLPDTPL